MSSRSGDGALRARRFCPACGAGSESFTPGPNGRPDAACPQCGSLERHRFLALLLENLAPYVGSARAVLEVAPSRVTTQMLARLRPPLHVRMDFDPGADARVVDVQASITDMPFADGVFDVVLCYHVLEHVPDDRAGMRELARVLSPGGIALVQVPWRPGTLTDEDPSAPVEQRIARFGQADHVRYYGRDFDDRLAESGLEVFRFDPRDVLTPELTEAIRVSPHETVWVLRRRGALPAGSDVSGVRLSILGRIWEAQIAQRDAQASTAAEVADLRQAVKQLTRELRAAERRAEQHRRRYEQLRSRLPLRLAAAATRPARRLLRARR
jgi:SAM-dependent methyltransferase